MLAGHCSKLAHHTTNQHTNTHQLQTLRRPLPPSPFPHPHPTRPQAPTNHPPLQPTPPASVSCLDDPCCPGWLPLPCTTASAKEPAAAGHTSLPAGRVDGSALPEADAGRQASRQAGVVSRQECVMVSRQECVMVSRQGCTMESRQGYVMDSRQECAIVSRQGCVPWRAGRGVCHGEHTPVAGATACTCGTGPARSSLAPRRERGLIGGGRQPLDDPTSCLGPAPDPGAWWAAAPPGPGWPLLRGEAGPQTASLPHSPPAARGGPWWCCCCSLCGLGEGWGSRGCGWLRLRCPRSKTADWGGEGGREQG